MTPRAEIRKELTDRLVPVLLSAGFDGPREIAGNALLHEYRRKGPSGTHVLRIQLEKRGKPRFILHLYIEPLEGIDAVISKGGTVVGAFVKPKRGPYVQDWFRSDSTLWDRLTRKKRTAGDAVSECLAVFPEIEAWWVTRASSAHVFELDTAFPGTR